MQNSSFLKNLSNGISSRIARVFHNPYQHLNLGWFRIKYLKHLTPGKMRRHHLFGKEFFFENPAELLHGFKEIFVDRLYLQDLPANPYIIDCGANIGLSVIYLKKQFPDSEIIAFEPDQKNFGILEKNINSFGFQNVTIRKQAIWKENTTLDFAVEGSMSSKIMFNGNGSSTEKVEAIRLRDMLIRPVDFLKIDIEGAEFEVLKDLQGSLHQVRNMFVEYHGSYGQNEELCNLLQIITREGFHFYIKEAASVYDTPFLKAPDPTGRPYDLQLNIFCFRHS